MKTPAPPWGPGLSVVWGEAVPYETPARPGGPGLSVVWGEPVRYENSCTCRRIRAVCDVRVDPGCLWHGMKLCLMKLLHVQEDPGCLWYGVNLCVMKTPAPPWGPGLTVAWVEAVRNRNSCTTRRTRAVCGSKVNLCVMKTPARPEGPGLSVVWDGAVPFETPAPPWGPGLSVSWVEAVRNKNSSMCRLSVVRGRTCAL
ncbi:hypothetical protein NDU88_012566 [Pleurodeles waltl]|uniref:Uncharacterized protein n=1 Tax=Pleurodeles waltl TaxID=8319 RepID=A0AAV7R1U1_PLEWA|nr:hypothetical protein NDU88_012566 [Pleurodeles waltl]